LQSWQELYASVSDLSVGGWFSFHSVFNSLKTMKILQKRCSTYFEDYIQSSPTCKETVIEYKKAINNIPFQIMKWDFQSVTNDLNLGAEILTKVDEHCGKRDETEESGEVESIAKPIPTPANVPNDDERPNEGVANAHPIPLPDSEQPSLEGEIPEVNFDPIENPFSHRPDESSGELQNPFPPINFEPIKNPFKGRKDAFDGPVEFPNVKFEPIRNPFKNTVVKMVPISNPL